MATTTRTITIPQQLNPVSVLGPQDQVLQEIERAFPELTLIVRGNRIAILSHGKETESLASQAQAIVETLIDTAFTAPMDADTVRRLLSRSSQTSFHDLAHQWATDPGARQYYQKLTELQDTQSHHAEHERRTDQSIDTTHSMNTTQEQNAHSTNRIIRNPRANTLSLDHTVEGDEIAEATTSTLYQPPLFGVDRDEYDDDGSLVAQDTQIPLAHRAHKHVIREDQPYQEYEHQHTNHDVESSTSQQISDIRDPRDQHVSVKRQLTQQGAQLRVPGVITHALGAPVRPKTPGQIEYVNAIESHTITFGIGPAGTGKTYLAVAKAVRAFEQGQVNRIILTRPAVEAGENLGFLPGTLHDKVDPYLRPLYDALADMLGTDRLRKLMADGTIEVAPLAYMRGRTLNDAYVILDEAQNTTAQQMKMFLTRLGFNTRMVITGDATQADLTVPHSGLADIEHILHGIADIAFVHLQAEDVVRHRLVGQIVQAYERAHAAAGTIAPRAGSVRKADKQG